jgi:hypothetical protein
MAEVAAHLTIERRTRVIELETRARKIVIRRTRTL